MLMKEKQHVCLASLAKFARSSPITLWDGSISERNLYKLARVWDIRDTPGHTFFRIYYYAPRFLRLRDILYHQRPSNDNRTIYLTNYITRLSAENSDQRVI